MRRFNFLVVCFALGSCVATSGSTSPSGNKERETDAEPVLRCTQPNVYSGRGTLEVQVFDNGPAAADFDPDKYTWGLTEDYIDEGIQLREYRVVGSYSVELDGYAYEYEVDASYYGSLYKPDANIYTEMSSDDPYRFYVRSPVENDFGNAGFTVEPEDGVHVRSAFDCEGVDALPTYESLLPSFSYTDVVCTAESVDPSGRIGVARFTVRDMDKPQTMALVQPDGEDENGEPVSPIAVTPDDAYLSQLVSGVGNGGLGYRAGASAGHGQMRITSDDDGVTFGRLVLYEDSGYTRGYFKYEGDPDEWYTTLSCETSPHVEQANNE